jgi:DNA (cytosine-5)-methyltransferase 1
MTAYYNENDPKAAEWLRNLILMGEIAEGIVDERSIEDVKPVELLPYTQCHFFAGIGGWSYALRLAGVSDATPVWTGSCPCQPFSAAGKGKGFADERHLWPAWFWLIQQCRPKLLFGEQVANALAWFDLVSADLEAKVYTVGAAVLGAHSVGAPHIRQRLYWVADANGADASTERQQHGGKLRLKQAHGSPVRLADNNNNNNRREVIGRSGLLDGERPAQRDDADGRGADGELGDAGSERRQQIGRGPSGDEGAHGRQQNADYQSASHGENSEQAAQTSFWSAHRSIPCSDGKTRIGPIEPEFQPLAHGVPGRMGLLRGYGNAIVPQAAAAFIKAYIGG